MARLVVGNGQPIAPPPQGIPNPITQIEFGFATVSTVFLDFEPELDPSGKDYLSTKATLEVEGIVSRAAICTNRVTVPPNTLLGQGDDLAFTIFQVRDFLMTPRLYFRFEVGSQVVLESPAPSAVPVQGSNFFRSDARGGPFPRRANYTQFSGEKMAYLRWRVECHLNYGAAIILSNRWTQTASISREGFTTLTTRGRAILRKDYMDAQPTPLQGDDYRRWFIVPVPDGMTRTDVTVTESEDGTEIEYSATDDEHTIGLGAASTIREVTGSVTGGMDYPVKDVKAAAEAAAKTTWNTLKGLNDPIGALQGLASRLWNTAVPTARFVGLARAVGRKDADRGDLQRLACGWILDRLSKIYNPAGGLGVIVSAYVTMNTDTLHAPFCEARLEVLGASLNIVGAVFRADVGSLLNTSSNFAVGLTNPIQGPNTPGPALPNSGGTRGTWIGRLISQTLRAGNNAYAVPDSPPASQTATDTAGPN